LVKRIYLKCAVATTYCPSVHYKSPIVQKVISKRVFSRIYKIWSSVVVRIAVARTKTHDHINRQNFKYLSQTTWFIWNWKTKLV